MRATKRSFLWIAAMFAAVAMLVAAFFGAEYWVERLRVRDATLAFEPLSPLNPEILSQPIACQRYRRYIVEFSAAGRLNDENVSTLESMNELPTENSLDVVISTPEVTDASLPVLLSLRTVDILDVKRTRISDAGIEELRKGLTETTVLRRPAR
jgi:hypothetical protein